MKDDATPIYKLEQELGMPPTTLQKALTGGRNLPKKWALKLRAKFEPKEAVPEPIPKPADNRKVKIQDLTKQTNIVKPITGKPQSTNISIDTAHPRLKGETSIEYRIRMAELQTKKQ